MIEWQHKLLTRKGKQQKPLHIEVWKNYQHITICSITKRQPCWYRHKYSNERDQKDILTQWIKGSETMFKVRHVLYVTCKRGARQTLL